MASGRMEFHADTIMQHTGFSFVLPNDVYTPEIKDLQYYDRPAKTLILLHGLTGTDTDWLYGGVAQEMAIQFNLAVFMPTTGNSFYLDRGYPGGNYASFVGEEFPDYIRKTFGYCTAREDTLIAGLSMGGYGALHLALAFPDTFCGCIALSSALRIRDLAEKGPEGESVLPAAMVRDLFGDPEKLLDSDKNPEYQYRKLKESGTPIPKIYLACGTEDPLLRTNHVFRDFLKNQNADYRFEEGPGVHNWTFWNEYLPKGLEWILKE
ncbi:MAG: acetylesterase [Oscillospiraceae bacterium]|nr:acetylesterase [Oscillospiraceae bacterium]